MNSKSIIGAFLDLQENGYSHDSLLQSCDEILKAQKLKKEDIPVEKYDNIKIVKTHHPYEYFLFEGKNYKPLCKLDPYTYFCILNI